MHWPKCANKGRNPANKGTKQANCDPLVLRLLNNLQAPELNKILQISSQIQE